MNTLPAISNSDLKQLLLQQDPEFWTRLGECTRGTTEFSELFMLSSLRRKAHSRSLSRPVLTGERLRIALMGAYTLYPFSELLEHFFETEGMECDVWRGEFDNYASEILDPDSEVYRFAPHVVVLMPSEHRCKYPGALLDSRQAQTAEAEHLVNSLLEQVGTLHERTRAEVIVTNFLLPARHDLGAYRSRTLGSVWSYRKWVNLQLGFNAPPYVHICDLEFLAYRRGGIEARDDRAWFESKQPCSPSLLVDAAREVVHLTASLRRPPRKVLVLDLDNTLWGGVLAEDGLEGIEIGDTSPRGEAFKAFQAYILTLKQRGILLAVCSKNDHAVAAAAFENHPEMVLKLADFAAFKANWEPKSENIRQIAEELNLGIDSLVFVDDNPAEIEIVRQFAPSVATILLGPDPSEYVAQLQDCRFFEARSITAEDAVRTSQYRAESQRKALLASITDLDSYLESLGMEASMSEFTAVDAPRIAQLINKSNQFNLTTRRRTDAAVLALLADSDYRSFTVRLKDRFGDHGLISIVIGQIAGNAMKIDTWLMSCRVLKRQVEEEVLNELARLAICAGCTRLEGVFIPTPKNEMVRDFYPRMGFALQFESEESREFSLDLRGFKPRTTKIQITRRAYEPS